MCALSDAAKVNAERGNGKVGRGAVLDAFRPPLPEYLRERPRARRR